MNTTFKEKYETLHVGHNIKHVREIQRIKQEAFGQLCHNKYSQQRISDFEYMVALEMMRIKVKLLIQYCFFWKGLIFS